MMHDIRAEVERLATKNKANTRWQGKGMINVSKPETGYTAKPKEFTFHWYPDSKFVSFYSGSTVGISAGIEGPLSEAIKKSPASGHVTHKGGGYTYECSWTAQLKDIRPDLLDFKVGDRVETPHDGIGHVTAVNGDKYTVDADKGPKVYIDWMLKPKSFRALFNNFVEETKRLAERTVKAGAVEDVNGSSIKVGATVELQRGVEPPTHEKRGTVTGLKPPYECQVKFPSGKTDWYEGEDLVVVNG
jgi:hypothetical protein